LQNGFKQPLKLPFELRRAEFSRSEILGRIGMLPLKQKGSRFLLEYLATPNFLQQIDQILTSDDNSVLIIPCNKDEYTQFDLDGSS
jgi:hypothetical protein